MHSTGGGQRHRLVVVVGALLIVMTAVIVGVTVWVVTQQSAADTRAPTETLVNYVGWDTAPPVPESDASRRAPIRVTPAPAEETPLLETSPPESDPGGTAQPSLTQFSAGMSLNQPTTMEAGDYPQNVAEVMKHMHSQQLQQSQLGQTQGVRQGGTIQSYGVLETYPSQAWPATPNRMGQAFQGVAYPFQPQQMSPSSAPSSTSSTWSSAVPPTDAVPETSGASPQGGLRPFHSEPEHGLDRERGPSRDQDRRRDRERDRPLYRRRQDENRGRPRRPPPRRQPPPFRSRSEVNRTQSDPTVSAGLDLAVSGWSAFSFGIFLIKKLLQIMGYGGHESRAILDETDMFLRALEVAGRVTGFDASSELAVLEQDVSLSTSTSPEGRSWSAEGLNPAQEEDEVPPLSKTDLVNRLFGVGLNLVNLFTSKGDLNVAECLWGAYCEELQDRSRKTASTDAIVAKVNAIGLQLIRGQVEDYIGVGEMVDMIRDSRSDQCSQLFPACHGQRAAGFMADLLGPGMA